MAGIICVIYYIWEHRPMLSKQTVKLLTDNYYLHILQHYHKFNHIIGIIYFSVHCKITRNTCIILCSPPRHVEAQDMEGGIWHTCNFQNAYPKYRTRRNSIPLLQILLRGMNEDCVHFLKLCFVLLRISSNVVWNVTFQSPLFLTSNHHSQAMDVVMFQEKFVQYLQPL
jgi:hypothetical protein